MDWKDVLDKIQSIDADKLEKILDWASKELDKREEKWLDAIRCKK